ncbi:sulfurtransferase [Luteimonas sp. M1R5S18]|uniref:Sulfurtransferase n=1 Tax=Luteimonas rhizosphaericola TaxID=3042024 RepID=A0ABT6JJ50_9GAMM|nr:sulfurtransferase [Luteimonas rhizosphaericola]MDH5830707.1 sulfurtransferase [Luteimonas rhizosphaericola]
MTMHEWPVVIAPQALAALLDAPDVVVVDCRASLADPDAGERAWRAAHMPGARHAHLERDLSRRGPAGEGRHPWPRAEAFTAQLGAWGIGRETRVVAYDESDGAFAARLWGLLHMLGHPRAAVLDGGWAAWTALGLPRDAEVPAVVPARYAGDFDVARLLDGKQVQAHLAGGGVLVDARAPQRFRGEVEPIDAVAGHVPGAVNRPYTANLDGGRFRPAPQLRAEFEALLGGRAPRELVAMCGSGVTACHHLLAMEHAGLPGARLYTGSWSGWIADPARPVATGAD